MSDLSHDGNSMEQVRELLFGAQVKAIEEHLQKQEAHIMGELAALRDELRKAMLELEATLSARLEAEGRERGQVKLNSEQQLARLGQELEKRSAELNALLDKSESSLKALISSENMRITGTVEEQYKSTLSSLSQSTAQIREDMVDRNSIAALLMELAGKIAPPAAGVPPGAPDKRGKKG